MSSNINALKDYFNTGATQTYAFRLLQLERLKKAVMDSEKVLYEALHADLKKQTKMLGPQRLDFS